MRSGVDLTVVSATVYNADGGLAQGLSRDAFEIYEDGDRQPIAQFTNERVPIGLGLLLDVSDCMFGRRIVDARAAVERFLVELLAPTDEFFVLAFITPRGSSPAGRVTRPPCGRRWRPRGRQEAQRSTTQLWQPFRRSSSASVSAPHW